MRNMGWLFIAIIAIGVVGALNDPAASTGRTSAGGPSQAAFDAQAKFNAQVKIVGEAFKKANNLVGSISIPGLGGRATASLIRASEKHQMAHDAAKAQDWPTATQHLVVTMDFLNAALKIGTAAKKVEPYVVPLRASLAQKRQKLDAALACWKGQQAKFDVAEKSLQAAVNTMGADAAPSVSQTFGASEALESVTLNCK